MKSFGRGLLAGGALTVIGWVIYRLIAGMPQTIPEFDKLLSGLLTGVCAMIFGLFLMKQNTA